jgi:hypothetical protein
VVVRALFLPSLPGASYSSENPPPTSFPPLPFLVRGKKRESRDIGEFPVNGTSPMIGAHKMRKRKKRKKAKLEAFDVGAFSRLRVVNADVAIAIGTFTHVSILSKLRLFPTSFMIPHPVLLLPSAGFFFCVTARSRLSRYALFILGFISHF